MKLSWWHSSILAVLLPGIYWWISMQLHFIASAPEPLPVIALGLMIVPAVAAIVLVIRSRMNNLLKIALVTVHVLAYYVLGLLIYALVASEGWTF